VGSSHVESDEQFRGIAAISSENAWAVGEYYDNNSLSSQSLIEHWDGTHWSIVPSANVASYANSLFGVAAISSDDIWTVGYYNDNLPRTLIEHWDGTSWSIVSSPSPGYYANYLSRVAVVSTNNVWPVGHYFNGSSYQTLIEHWNGTSWSIRPSPNTHSYLSPLSRMVRVPHTTQVWAVGYSENTVEQGLIEVHYC
jgi:hypothetical protein